MLLMEDGEESKLLFPPYTFVHPHTDIRDPQLTHRWVKGDHFSQTALVSLI